MRHNVPSSIEHVNRLANIDTSHDATQTNTQIHIYDQQADRNTHTHMQKSNKSAKILKFRKYT